MDLSVADLMKNRIMLLCGNDEEKRTRVLRRWEEVVSNMNVSRFSIVDFIRFYWIAFHSKTTKKQLYREVRNHLNLHNVENEMDSISSVAQAFAEMTDKELIYPSTGLISEQKALAELNTLRYTLCYPTLIWLSKNRPASKEKIANAMKNFLFRVITIGGLAVRTADKAFDDILTDLRSGLSDDDSLTHLASSEIDDEQFKRRLLLDRFESNDTPKYLWAKIYENEQGIALTPNFKSIHLEHILPIKYESNWGNFDTGEDKEMKDWIYSIGNTAILEAALNQSISNKSFSDKIEFYKEKTSGDITGTAIPDTYKIHEDYQSGQRDWTKEKIKERAEYVANLAVDIWPSN